MDIYHHSKFGLNLCNSLKVITNVKVFTDGQTDREIFFKQTLFLGYVGLISSRFAQIWQILDFGSLHRPHCYTCGQKWVCHWHLTYRSITIRINMYGNTWQNTVPTLFFKHQACMLKYSWVTNIILQWWYRWAVIKYYSIKLFSVIITTSIKN